jgi:hypothetical protein
LSDCVVSCGIVHFDAISFAILNAGALGSFVRCVVGFHVPIQEESIDVFAFGVLIPVLEFCCVGITACTVPAPVDCTGVGVLFGA